MPLDVLLCGFCFDCVALSFTVDGGQSVVRDVDSLSNFTGLVVELTRAIYVTLKYICREQLLSLLSYSGQTDTEKCLAFADHSESSKEAIAMEKLKARGALPHDPSGISHSFWALEEEDVESAPRDMKLKWKRLLQKRSGCSSDIEGDPVSGEDGDSKWPDLPMELLVRIMTLVDNRTVIVASGVCHAWRDSLRQGVMDLSFSWCVAIRP